MHKQFTPKVAITWILLASTTPWSSNSFSQSFSGIYSQPLIGNTSAAPLVLLTMQRDARLFVEAYDDASDINGDGIMDVKYNPNLLEYNPVSKAYTSSVLDYYGYFDPYKCYEYKSYSYRDTDASSNKSINAFVPIGNTDSNTKKCASYTKDSTGLTKPWSGDFLNYLTTTRMDALRKVLYGGKRFVDFKYYNPNKTSATVLERANIPQDLHAYGKEYNSTTVDGYDIADYTPLSQPASGKRHLFANVTLGASPSTSALANQTYNPPLLRILKDRTERAWDWIAAETTAVAGSSINGVSVTPVDLNVRTVVCDSSGGDDQRPIKGADANGYCKTYGSNSKPTGILHEFGEQNSVYFGLLTGSFIKNFSGGVLRKAISSFTDEVNATTGEFTSKYYNDAASVKGIAYTVDRIQVLGFSGPGGSYSNSGEASSSTTVGNPIAEMMYEGLRYLAGQTRTTDYWDSSSLDANNLSSENPKLPAVLTWTNPYGGSGFNVCAKPTQMVLSDVTPTFDSDKLPSSKWAAGVSFSGTLGTLDAASLADTIWTAEGLGTKNVIIGEKYSDSTDVGMPTTKSNVTSFSLIRGLVPEDPMWQGSYYAAAIAKFGKENDLKSLGNSAFASSSVSNRVVNTAAVALSSSSPRIQIPFDDNGTKIMINVVPFALTYNGGWKLGEFIRFWVDNIKNVPGAPTDSTVNNGDPYYKMQVVFSDNSLYQTNGQDNDMDSRATYEVYLDKAAKKVYVNVCADPNPAAQTVGSLSSATQTVRCNKDGVNGVGYSATGVTGMHIGYFISGVSIPSGEKPTRLVVRNNVYNNNSTDQIHTLDYPDARIPGTFVDNYFDSSTSSSAGLTTYQTASDGTSLRLNNSLSYDISSSTAGGEFIPHDPLWYAAKYGGYNDSTPNNKQLDGTEWVGEDGVTPVGYYQVINPALLKDQITNAIKPTLISASSFAATASNSTDLKTLTAVYQGKYVSKYWSGQLLAYSINGTTGAIDTTTPVWNASTLIPAAASRNIFTYRMETPAGIQFKWSTLNAAETAKLANASGQLDYIRGDRSNEGTGSSNYRVRDPSTVLGDIVNSQPVYAGGENLGYATLSGTAGSTYADYLTNTKAKSTRSKMIYVGANDGMLHGFRASDGVELFAYIPRAILWGDNASQLSSLTSKTYAHKYFVDGPIVVDDFFNGSAWQSVLVGTLGAGGKSIYALNITDPDNFSASSVMWEFSHPELGYVRSPPVIARLKDGNWYAITGNGLESNTCNNTSSPRYEPATAAAPQPSCNDTLGFTARNAKLFLIKLNPDLSDGWTHGSDYFVIHATDSQTVTIPPSVSGTSPVVYSNGTDNGLSGPALIDGSNTSAVNYVYAGDLQGNIWKFDLSSSSPSAWTTAYKLFQAKDSTGVPQPITTSLAVGTYPSVANTMCVSAGTGRFVYEGDLIYKGVQSTYGIQDAGAALTGASRTDDLQQFSIVEKKTETFTDPTGATLSHNTVYISNETFDNTKHGWFLDLREPATATLRDIGERIIQPPIQTKLRTNELLATFVTSVPTGDTCDATGASYQLDFNACTGEGLSIPTFDLDGSATFDSVDLGTPSTGTRLGGVQVGAAGGGYPNSAMCFESKTGGIKGCSFDLGILSCTDGRIETVKKPPTSLVCGISRTSWRQLR